MVDVGGEDLQKHVGLELIENRTQRIPKAMHSNIVRKQGCKRL